MAVFADYKMVLSTSQMFTGQAIVPISYSGTEGQPAFLDIGVLGNWLVDPTDPNQTRLLQTVNMVVVVGVPTVITVHRWLDHDVMILDHPLIMIPSRVNELTELFIYPVGAAESFFLGPITLFFRAPE
jgi:hypothetical protein